MLNTHIRDNLLSLYDQIAAGQIVKYQTADKTVNNSTTPVNTDLQFPIAANEVWFALYMLKCSTNGAQDWAHYLDGPASPSAVIFAPQWANGVDGVGAAVTAFATKVTTLVTGTPLNWTQLVWGFVFNGTNAGNITYQFAQNTAGVADSILYKGSSMLARRLA
jgi:hypothetical protein